MQTLYKKKTSSSFYPFPSLPHRNAMAVNTTSAIVGGNMIREDLILEAIDRHDAKDLAEATLIAEGFGVHVPKGYIYAAMAFSGLVEGLNIASRAAKRPH